MDRLQGRTAVVTGAASGIGLALARRLASEGMRIVLADMDAGKLDAAADEVRAAGGEAMTATVDVTQASQIAALAKRVESEWGTPAVVCNNAGVLGRVMPSWEQPIENWKWVFDVNVAGVVNGIHAFVPGMIASGQPGYVLNTASIAGMITGPFFAPYNASKHAVVALSECLHHELRQIGSRVEVGILCPGWVRTGLADFEEKVPEELRETNAELDAGNEAAQRDAAVRQMVKEASTPEAIAGVTVEALKAGKFYIFPHPERKAGVEKRMGEILAEEIPEFG